MPPEGGEGWRNGEYKCEERREIIISSLSAGCRPLLRPLLDTLCRSAHHSTEQTWYRNPGLVTFPFDQSIDINTFIILDYLSL